MISEGAQAPRPHLCPGFPPEISYFHAEFRVARQWIKRRSDQDLLTKRDQFPHTRLADKNPSPRQHAKNDRENALEHGMAYTNIRHNGSSEIAGEQNGAENGGSWNRIKDSACQHERAD